jgi:transglutaminase-like putative cysteine protease
MGGTLFVHARIAAGTLLCALAPFAAAAESTRWQVVNANQTKIGQVRISRSETATGFAESEQLDLQLGKSGRRALYRVTLETESGADGALLRLAREVQTREGHARIEARVTGDDLEVRRGLAGAATTQRLEGVARDLKSTEYERAWLASVSRGESPEPLRYRSWDPVKVAVVEVELVVRRGDAHANVERHVRGPRESSSTLLCDASGNVVREIMPLGGFEFERVDATEEEARRPNGVFDHVAPLLQKSPYRIPSGDMDQKIRYRFDNHGDSVALPFGAGQRTWIEGESTWLQVCASCPLDAVELSADERRRALEPTQWLESADPQLSRRARGLVRHNDDPATRMRRFTDFVRGHMGVEIDMLGYGTALEALRSRRGDCTEFAVLLAALGRAAGVPTRIAIGRVYARHFEGYRHVFVPHSWVQAWTGQGWESFDAAIGTFDSTHLAFAVSYDGNPMTHFDGITLSRELTLRAAARVLPRKVAN